MKTRFLTLTLLVAAAAVQPVLAQVGTSNGSGSGFLNNDITVGHGGTPGPAELNLRLGGASNLSPYRLLGPRVLGVNSVQGRIISQPAVITGSGMFSGACGGSIITQPAVIDSCANPCGTTVIQQPAVITMPAVCPSVCPPSSNLIVPGMSAPTLVDF